MARLAGKARHEYARTQMVSPAENCRPSIVSVAAPGGVEVRRSSGAQGSGGGVGGRRCLPSPAVVWRGGRPRGWVAARLALALAWGRAAARARGWAAAQ